MDKFILPPHLQGRVSKSLAWKVPKRIFFIYPSYQSDGNNIKDELIHRVGEGLISKGHSVIICKINTALYPAGKTQPRSAYRLQIIGPIKYIDIFSNSLVDNGVILSPNISNTIDNLLNVYKPSLVCFDFFCKDLIILADKCRARNIPYGLYLSNTKLSGANKGALEQYRLIDGVLKNAKIIYSQTDIADSEIAKFGIADELSNYIKLPHVGEKSAYEIACIDLLAKISSEVGSSISIGDGSEQSVVGARIPSDAIPLIGSLSHQNPQGLERLDLAQAYFQITSFFEAGVSYKVSGQFESLTSEIKNPALIQFQIDGVQDIALTKSQTGLSYSETTGFYKYLNPIKEDKFEFSISIPINIHVKSIGIRAWGSVKELSICNFRVQPIGRPNSLSQSQIDDIKSGYLSKGLGASKMALLDLKNIQAYELADRLEQLFFIGFADDAEKLADLAVIAYQKDPSVVRGKRLITKCLERGLLRAPSLIAEDLLSRSICTLDEEKTFKRVISKYRLSQNVMTIPNALGSAVYDVDKNNSLYFLYSSLPHQSSGYATRSHRLLTALNKGRGRNFIAYTRPGYPWDIGQLKQPALDYDDVSGVVYRHLMGTNLFKQELDVYMEAAVGVIKSVARNNSASILHAASNHLNAAPVLVAARELGLPFVYEIRGFWELTQSTKVDFDWTSSEAYKYDYAHETLMAQEADSVIVLTDGLKKELISRGVESNKIVIASNGVDAEEFSDFSKDVDLGKKLGLHPWPTIGFVGSFVAYEGLDDLVVAASQLRKSGYFFNLLLVGDGPELEKIRDLIIELNLSDIAFLTGRVPFDEVQKYYSLIDIAPFPRKPLPVCEMVSPLKPFEAMAMGKAVLASNVLAMAEFIVDGQNGYLFEKGSIEDLVSKLSILIENPDNVMNIGNNGRAWVQKERTWSKAASVIEQVHNDLAFKWFGV
jgi:glycosyltransferase involved in cell wall biosynthesis